MSEAMSKAEFAEKMLAELRRRQGERERRADRKFYVFYLDSLKRAKERKRRGKR